MRGGRASVLLVDMKFAAVLFLALGGVVSAQDFVAPSGQRREIVPQMTEPQPSIEGIVRSVFVDKKPWQLVNPLAPKQYGTGEKFVSRDFGPATPFHSTTVTVVGVEW